jgi:hypothetical protein
MTITKQQAKALKHGDMIHSLSMRNSDGTPLRARVNGKCRTWARSPSKFEVPIKHGLRDCGYLTDGNAHAWALGNGTAPVHNRVGSADYVGDHDYEGRLCVLKVGRRRLMIGDALSARDGDVWTVQGGRAPTHEGSSGRIYVTKAGIETEFFPHVFSAKWVRV